MPSIQTKFRKLGSKKIAAHSQRFFKTGKGEYGYGDVFLGIRVPVIRKFAKEHADVNLTVTKSLIKSKFHEERLLGLLLLVNKYGQASSEKERERLYKTYLAYFKYINNWDLVDVTCPHIIGRHLEERDRGVLFRWAKSNDLWTRRIAMISNWWFIREGDLSTVFRIADVLLEDEHDLIHKAVGWMLREAGKVDFRRADQFVGKRVKRMPRTMLRYAIERYPEKRRQQLMKA